MKRRWSSVLLSLCLALSLMPAVTLSAGAADDYPKEYKQPALDAVVDRWHFYNRECTSFVAWCMESRNGVTFDNYYVIVDGTRTNVRNSTYQVDNNGNGTRLGNAMYWGSAFRSMGFAVNSTPAVGSIAWWDSGTHGHVAWVSAVSGSSVTVEEYNWSSSNRGVYGTRTVAASSFSGFIHVKDLGSSGDYKPIVGKGYATSGAAVTRLQTMLNTVNNAGLETDGIFGTKTETAVKNYQSKKGLTVDGICGAQTWAALEADYKAATEPAAASSRPRVGYGFTTRGDDVKDLQTMLNAVSGAGLEVDGIFGNASLNALKAYQSGKGLEADGICGPLTWAALEADYQAIQAAPLAPEFDAHTHSLVRTAAKDAACTAGGNKAYWTCSECGKVFSDAEGTAETTAAAMTLPALGHDYQNGVCTRCGEADPNDPPPGTGPSVPGQTFTDVPAGAYYAAAVQWAVENGVTTGTTAATFSPDDTVTRGQAVTFLWRAMGKPAPKSSVCPFADVQAGDYYCQPVLWAVEQGITNGTSATAFSPDATLTRAHIVTFLWRTAGRPGSTGASLWYEDAVTWGRKNGLLSGTAQAFTPDGSCPRADVVTYLYRCVQKGVI